MPSVRRNRTFALILVAWAVTAGLYATHNWSPWPWVAVVIGSLSLWIGGKAAAAAIAGRIPTGG